MVLESLKVVELADGFAGPFCGLQFADAGAEVIKIESPEGDRTRKIGPYTNGVSHLFLALNRGKKSVVLDLGTKEGAEAAKELIRFADVVIAHFPPGVAEAYGLDYESLKPINPRLIYASMSDFGSHGPLAARRGSELAAQAYSGIWRYLGDMTSREARAGLVEPVRAGTYVGSAWAGTFLFHGALAALLCRKRVGVGQKVESSLLGAIVSLMMNTWPVMSNPDKWLGFELVGPMGSPSTSNYTTKNGRISMTLSRSTRRGGASGIDKFYRDLGLDPNDPRLTPRRGNSFEKGEPGLELVNNALQRYTKEELTRIMNEEVGTQAAPINEYSDFVANPQTQHLGMVIGVDHPNGGKFEALRSPWMLMGTPTTPAGRPPLLGENTSEELKKIGWSEEQITRVKEEKPSSGKVRPRLGENREPPGAEYDGPGPLQGIRVVDFSMHEVGPWSGSLLGLLGAHVIKVEPPTGDEIISREPTQNGVPTPYLGFNQGKNQCVALDLKNQEDKEVAIGIIKEADVLIENFRTGVMARLGLDYETVSKLNPRLVYCSATGYGQTGSMAFYGCSDGYAAAFTGMMAINGPKGGGPEKVRVTVSDGGTSLAIVCCALLGLHAREITGKGQWAQTSMLEANSFWQTHRYAEYFATKANPIRSGSELPNIVPDQAFKTNDNYIAVSATTQDDWRNLCEALDLAALATDPRFATNDDRVKNREELLKMLGAKIETLPTWWWYLKFHKHDVPCGMYLSLEDVMQSDHFRQNKFLADVDVTIAGKMTMSGPPFQFSETPSKIVTPAVGVIPKDQPAVHQPLDRTKYPDGYPGEHTALLKERYKKKLPLFAM